MSITIELPEPLRQEIESDAAREGVSLNDHTALLLYIITTLQDATKNTPFQKAVKEFLASRSLDADRVAVVLDELVQICLTAPMGVGKTEAAMHVAADQEPSTTRTVFLALPYEALLRWGNAEVHSLPPSDRLYQVSGRYNRVTEGLPAVSPPEQATDAPGWPAGFFEETYGSLSDKPLERLPQGTNERREPLE